MKLAIATLLLLTTPLAVAQGHGPPQPGLAHFDVYADGDTIHLLTGVRGDDGVALAHRRSTDGGATWSAPVPVNAGGTDVFSPHPGENPQIAARGADVLAVWNAFDRAAHTRGPLAAAVSHDGGATWQATTAPDADGAAGYRPLPELAASANGFHAVWLHGASREAKTPQGVHYAASKDGAAWTKATAIDDVACDCCWNRVVATGDDVAVLYRGADPRDMRVARADGATWGESVPVGDFKWDFQGCPHVGGALAASADTLHALVWTGKDDVAGLHYLRSTNGAAWTAPARIGDAKAQNSDIVAASDTVTILWDGTGNDAVVRRMESKDGGATWQAPAVVSSSGAAASHPRAVATRHGVATFWYERKDGVRTLVVNGKPMGS